MDQRVSGFRIWLWGIFFMVFLGLVVLVAVLKGQGFDRISFNPRLALAFGFIACAVGAFVLINKGRREDKSDLPNTKQ